MNWQSDSLWPTAWYVSFGVSRLTAASRLLAVALTAMALFLVGCDDGSNPVEPDPPAENDLSVIRITEVSEENQWVEFVNIGDSPIDVSDGFLCVQGSYARVGDQPVVESDGNFTLDPGEWIAVEWDQIAAGNGTVAFYQNNDDFGAAENIVDYVRWGPDSGGGRESVAVDAGIWAMGDFVDAAPARQTLSFFGESAQRNDAPTDWGAGNPTPGAGNAVAPKFSDLRITELSQDNHWVEIVNTAPGEIDVSDAWLCVPGVYARVGDTEKVTVLSGGDLTLSHGEWVALEWAPIATDDGEIAVYEPDNDGRQPSFTTTGDDNRMVDYLRYGADASDGREFVAVDAGIWTTGDFVDAAPSGQTISFFGSSARGNDDPEDWAAGTPTPNAANEAAGSSGSGY